MQRLDYTPKHAATTFWANTPHIKIGVNYPLDSTADSFWESAARGVALAEERLKDTGVSIVRECSPSFHFEQQKKSIQNLIDQGVDAIVTTAFDSSTEFQFTNLIPSQIPYATVVNKPWSDDYLFHVGPNDEAMGSLMAKLVSLYCRKPSYIALIAPSIELDGTHNRISGFINKVNNELQDIHILQVMPVIAKTPDIAYRMLGNETEKILDKFSHLDALYITNGFVQPVCDMVKTSGRKGIQVFGHECFRNIKEYLLDGSLTATVYQNPCSQWQKAIMTMTEYLLRHTVPEKSINATCHVITKETLALTNFYAD